MIQASCLAPKKLALVELAVLQCRAMPTSQGFSGAYLSVLISAETTFPFEGPRTGLDPNSWKLIHHSNPQERSYFYYSVEDEPCNILEHDGTLLTQESEPCCDVKYEVEHPSCEGKVLTRLSGKLGELTEPKEVVQ